MTTDHIPLRAERLAALIEGLDIWIKSGRSGAPDLDHDTWRALTELQAIRGSAPIEGEAVAWQQRERKRDDPSSDWSRWYESSKDAFKEYTGRADHDGVYFNGSGRTEYQVRALSLALPITNGVTEEMVERVLQAVLSCPHTITREEIVLKYSHSVPGNATAQLHARILTALQSETR